jgi:predicted TIM-barrel fold metal-dependent hydrolase
MRTITLEEHITTPELLSARTQARPDNPSLEFLRAMNDKLMNLGEGRIADMDAAGIDVQVLSPQASDLDKLEAATAKALARDTNDKLAAAVQEHPKRFAAFATVALQDPEGAAAELERCIHELGFKGVMVSGTVQGLFLDDPRFTPLFETAQALDVPIYLHPAPPPQPVLETYFGGLPRPLSFVLSTAAWGWHVETGMHCLRLIITGVFDRFPKLKIIIGHMGENLPFSIARADTVFSRSGATLKRRVAEYFHDHFYITTSGYFTLPPFQCALQVMGADRILFSVDYPFSPCTAGRNFLDSLPVSTEDMEKISYRNAERLLKL